MTKLRSKMGKRIMAFIITGAMMMSDMTAYASGLSVSAVTETSTEISTEQASGEEASKVEAVEETGEASVESTQSQSSEEASTEKASEKNEDAAAETQSSVEEEKSTEDKKDDSDVETTEEAATSETETQEETTTEAETEEETATEAETKKPVIKENTKPSNVKAADGFELNVSDLEAETIAADKVLGKFTLKATSEYSVTIDGNKKGEYTKRLKLSGAGSKEYRSIQFTTEGAAKLEIKGMSSSKYAGDERTVVLEGARGSKSTVEKVDGTQLNTIYFDISEADTYYVYSQEGGFNVYYIKVTPVESGSGSKDETDEFTRTYDFRDGSIVPTTTDGKSDIESPDKLIKITASSGGQYKYNGAQHGVQFVNGNVITLSAGTDSKITKVSIGMCKYSGNNTVKVQADKGSEEVKDLKGANCYDSDKTQVLDLTYDSGVSTVKLSFTATTYVPVIIVSGTEPKSSVTEIKAKVTVNDADKLLGATDKIELKSGDESVDITKGGEVTLKPKKTYSIETNNTDIKATIDDGKGNTSLQTGVEPMEFTVKVENTTVTVKPAITGTELGTNKVVAKDSSKSYELKNGETLKLPKKTKFALEVQNAEGVKLETWLAEIDSKSEFTSADKTLGDTVQELKIVVTSVENIKVTPSFTGLGLLGDNKVYVQAEGGEKIEAKNGQAMELKANTEYKLSVDAEGLAVAVEGKDTFKTGVKDQEITIAVSTPSTRTTEWMFYDRNGTKTGIAADNNGYKGTVGDILKGTDINGSTGILFFDKGSGIVEYDSNQLKFRKDCILYLPVKDDTTKVTYIQGSNSLKTDRPTYVGGTDSGYSVVMPSGTSMVTIEDVTDLLAEVEKDGKKQKYLPIVSGGDVKLDMITLVEYNPVNTVTVSGTITGAADAGVKSVIFKNMDNDSAQLIRADVDAQGKYSAKLKRVAGNTQYAASIAVTGWKIDDDNDKDKFTLTGNGATATADFSVVKTEVIKVSGKITGIDEAKLKGELGVKLVPDNKAISPIKLDTVRTSKGVYAFEQILLDIGREYAVELTNADDYEVKESVKLTEGSEAVIEIKATEKAAFEVKGKFVTSDRNKSDVTKITFTNMDTPKYTYTFDVTEDGYVAQLRTGSYVASVSGSSKGYKAYDHVDVLDKAVENDVYLQGAVDNSPVPYAETVEVGSGKQFETIADAVAYVSRMERSSTQRVTISLEKKVYREQLVINTPNVTIKGNGATITWYYGVGFEYYSAKLSADGKSAYYDEAYAVDKYYKQQIGQNPGHWGATVNLLQGAYGFAAEDLTFENSLNRYMTDEELADGAAENADAGVLPRAKGLDVKKRKAKERACVLYIQADNTEYKNCKLLSGQDTLYTGDANENSYFKNCVIEGTVDYICGDGNPVFDGCTLSMYGYSDEAATGLYIVANKEKADHGYLFNSCKIVNSTQEGLKPSSNNVLVRSWGAGTVRWLNTEVESKEIIDGADAYRDMNAKAKDGHYYEYNTHLPDGTPVITDVREKDKEEVKLLTKEEADAIVLTDWFGNWAPTYYEAKDYSYNVSEITLDIDAPEALAKVSSKVSCTQPGIELSSLAWYVGETLFEGASFEGETVYTAKLTAKLNGKYNFATTVTAKVDGAEKTAVEVKDGVASITVTYPATKEAGYYEISLTNGLKKGVTYNGGISVMEDMKVTAVDPAIEIDGLSYNQQVQGSSNPSPNKGAIPATGAVLVIDALRDGVLKVALKSTGGKQVHFVKDTGDDLLTNEKPSANKIYTLPVEEGSTYYFYGDGTKVTILGITVDYRQIEREPWDTVENPEITEATAEKSEEEGALSANPGEIKVRVKGWIDSVGGADSVAVDMLNVKGEVVDTQASSKENSKENPITELTFKPDSSGDYSFVPRLIRKGETDKTGDMSKTVAFTLPMGKASIISITNKYKEGSTYGTLEIVWNKVKEAKQYEVTVTKKAENSTAVNGKEAENQETKPDVLYKETVDASNTLVMASNLPLNEDVTVSVVAIGKDADNRSTASMQDARVEGRFDRTWAFTAYGNSIRLDDLTDNKLEYNGYKKNENGSVTVYSRNGSGKVVPGSTDGLAFYYTAMDPDTENFTLTADVHVDNWKFSNGQDGFGLMVSDAVGVNGDGTAFWNNSYQLFSTKIEYNWDTVNKQITNAVSGVNGVDKYSMKLGLGWIAKTGTTNTDVAKIATGELSMPDNFSTSSGTLETYAVQAGKGAGTYNIIGNAESAVEGTISELTDFKLQIQRNNTGYILRYLNADGSIINEKKFYDDDRNLLTQIDKNNIYVGFVASRNAQITVSNISLTTINPADDAPAEEKETTFIDPDYRILSSNTSNSEEYSLIFYGNADGKLTVTNDKGSVLADGVDVSAKKKYTLRTTLSKDNNGENKFNIVFQPDKDYRPGEYQELSSYEKYETSFKVLYKEFDGEIIYVSPAGRSSNAGTKDSPADIYTAVSYAKAGQKIYMLGGVYRLSKPVLIDRAHDGTAESPIWLMGDPDDSMRPVLDFSRQTENATAMTLAGNYWHLKGFDVTKSKDGQKGLQVSGAYNIVEDIKAYKNGNTGIQISRYLGTDKYADWPSYNTILNCTSYLNADSGYEDADGFAAKLTVADGNRFVGCIAAYNADDGWDLFAKVQDGSIGAVTIDNCLAFKNGYLVDDSGKVINAGNGNGFKMGGDSMSGYHVLKNSIAFANKSKGIDSNSCPDIQVYNSISFNNEGSNVAMYTNTAVNTDYFATGIISLKTSNKIGETIKPRGTQNLSKIYNSTNFYFNGKGSFNSNAEPITEATTDWFVNVDVDKAINGGITRDADGSINLNGFLVLKDEYKDKVSGADIGGTSADDVIVETPEINVYSGAVKTLGEIKLPEGLKDYTWKHPETVVDVYNGTTASFPIWIKGEDGTGKDGTEKDVTVNFVSFVGVELTATDAQGNEKYILFDNAANESGEPTKDSLTLTASPIIYPVVSLDTLEGANVKYDIKETDKLSLNSVTPTVTVDETEVKVESQRTVTRLDSSKEGIAKFEAVMTVELAGKTTTFKSVCSFETRKTDAYIGFEEAENLAKNDFETTLKKDDIITFTNLEAVNVGSNTKVNAVISDNKVLKLESTSGNTYTYKAVGEGSATITFTSAADKNVSLEVLVYVHDGVFLKTNVSEITVDQAKTTGTNITAVACYGTKLASDPDIQIEEVLKNNKAYDKAGKFSITKVTGSIYEIKVTGDTNADKIPNGKYTVRLKGKVEVDGKETYSNFEPVTVNVIETRPSVTIKQTKRVNQFYRSGSLNSNGTITASSKQAKVTLSAVDDTSSFKLNSSGSGYTVVLKSNAGSRLVKRMKLNVTFSGYKSRYNIIRNIDIQVENRAPRIIPEVDNRVLYTQLGITDTAIRFLDKTTNTYVTSATVKLADSNKGYLNANKSFTLDYEAGDYILGTDKSGTAKISIKDADWNAEIIVNQPLTVNNNKPGVSFSGVRLNTNAEYIGMEYAASVINVKNALDYTVRGISIEEPSNTKAKQVFDKLGYYVSKDPQTGVSSLRIYLTGNEDLSKLKGTYTFNVSCTLNKLPLNSTVKVTLVDTKAPSIVTTRQSGSIDIVNRATSAITVKPSINNLNGKIVGMYLEGDACYQFYTVWDKTASAAKVYANEGIDLKRNGKYTVTPVFEVETEGGVVSVPSKPIKLTTNQSNVAVTSIKKPLELRMSLKNASAQTIVKATKPAGAQLIYMEQTNYFDNFVISYDNESGALTVKLINTRRLKANATYRIRVNLGIEGSGVNAKPQTITIPVKVIK